MAARARRVPGVASPAAVAVLGVLADRPAGTVELAAVSGVRRTSCLAVLSALIGAGLVERRGDRRSGVYHLTAQGRAAAPPLPVPGRLPGLDDATVQERHRAALGLLAARAADGWALLELVTRPGGPPDPLRGHAPGRTISAPARHEAGGPGGRLSWQEVADRPDSEGA